MQIDRRLPAEGLVEQVVFRRRGEVFRAAHDVADGHQVIVHDVGEVVGRQTVSLDEHVVIQRVAIHLDVAVEHVVEGRFARGRHVLADDVGLARRDAALGLLKADVVQALFVVFVGFTLGLGGLAVGLDLFLGAEAAVSAAFFDQLPSELGVEVAALGLDIRAVFAAHIRAPRRRSGRLDAWIYRSDRPRRAPRAPWSVSSMRRMNLPPCFLANR